jgi:FlaA1/EpsC-like NDP-sugar epimerase
MRRLDERTERFLLGRDIRSRLPAAVRDAFAGRRVMITGAGGSVGSELARQLAACGAAKIVLFDHAEYLLFRVSNDLQERETASSIVSVLGDVSRRHDIDTACRMHAPEFIFHAAASKHVTFAEQCLIPAARTNVLGAVFTAQAADMMGARFVLISTDKAAEPRSVMGATKRLAELSVLDRRPGSDAIAVRFGNVLGSSGSVVEILMDAARAGRPLTVTDPGATRFFMTAAEAVSLVLKAALSGRAGEVFWLDMGSPLRLADLVDRILDVVTPEGAGRPPVKVIGLRPGEKRNEELTTRDLAMEATDDPAIWRARQVSTPVAISRVLDLLGHACARGDAVAALDLLERAVIDYKPSVEACHAAARSTKPGVSAVSTLPERRLA